MNPEMEVHESDMSKLASDLPAADMMKISLEHLKIGHAAYQHCEEDANKKARPSWHRSFYCLQEWRKQCTSSNPRLDLFNTLTEAQQAGLVNIEAFSFLLENKVSNVNFLFANKDYQYRR